MHSEYHLVDNRAILVGGELQPYSINTIESILKVVKNKPNSQAIVNDSVSYLELWEMSSALLAHLRNLGVQKKHVVAIDYDMSVEYLISILAVMRLGASYISLGGNGSVLSSESLLKKLKCKVVLSPNGHFHNALTVGRDKLKGNWDLDLDAELAAIVMTSGSTGNHKLVPLYHKGISARLQWSKEDQPLGENAIMLCQLSPATLGGTMLPLTGLTQGAGLFLAPRELISDAPTFIAQLEKAKVTELIAMPSFLHMLILTGYSFRHVFRIFLTGEKCPDDLPKDLWNLNPEIIIATMYGLSECTGHALSTVLEKDAGSIYMGYPTRGTVAAIVGDDGRPLEGSGGDGILYLGGEGIAPCYLSGESLSKEKFPWWSSELLNTGDRVKWSKEYGIKILGRKDRQIKIRGFKVHMDHVESEISKYPGVGSCAVIAKDDALVCFIVLKNSHCRIHQIRKDLVAGLPSHFMPQRIEVIDKIPLTATHKKNYIALKKSLKTIEVDCDDSLLSMIQAYLKNDEISRQDDILAMGMDSYGVMLLCHKFQHKQLTPQMVYTYRTTEAIELNITNKKRSCLPAPKQFQPAIFGQLLMGSSYKNNPLIPNRFLGRILPLVKQRFFLSCLRRSVYLNKSVSIDNLQEIWRRIVTEQPIYKYRADTTKGYIGDHLIYGESSQSPVMRIDSGQWKSMEKLLFREICSMKGSLIYLVVVDEVLHILAHHSIVDRHSFDLLTEYIVSSLEGSSPQSSRGFLWSLDTPKKTPPKPIGESTYLTKRPLSFLIPISLRCSLVTEYGTETNKVISKSQFYEYFLECLKEQTGAHQVVVNEVVDLRYLDGVPEELFWSHGLQLGFMRLYLTTNSTIKDQLDEQFNIENLWNRSDSFIQRQLSRSWIFNFYPPQLNLLGYHVSDNRHPPRGRLIPSTKGIEVNVCLARGEFEFIYDSYQITKSTIFRFSEGLKNRLIASGPIS